MPLTAYDLSVAVFVRGLTQLKSLLMKGEAHASARGTDPSELVNARLAHDMYNLAVQVHWAAEGSKLAIARLIDVAMVPLAGEAKTFAELYVRIDEAIAYLRSVSPEDLEVGLERTIELKHRGSSATFTSGSFLLEFAIPNFFFHATTAYGILRHEGVHLTKADFTGLAF